MARNFQQIDDILDYIFNDSDANIYLGIIPVIFDAINTIVTSSEN